MSMGSVRRTLRRSSAVSAGALLVVLTGGGIALGGALPAGDSSAVTPLGAVSPGSTVSSVDSTVASTSSRVRPTPEPQTPAHPTSAPADVPVTNVLATVTARLSTAADGVVSTVTGLLASPPAAHGGNGGTSSGSTPSTPSHPAGPVATAHHRPLPATSSAGLALGHVRGEAAPLDHRANVTVTAATQPELTPHPFAVPTPLGALGKHSLPAAIVVIAFVAFAAVGAGHVGMWKNRLRVVSE